MGLTESTDVAVEVAGGVVVAAAEVPLKRVRVNQRAPTLNLRHEVFGLEGEQADNTTGVGERASELGWEQHHETLTVMGH
jgi:hypothetical protein